MNNDNRFKVLDGGKKDWPTPMLPGVRTEPHSPDAEAQLLATCLIDGRSVMAKCVAAGLKPAAFYERPNQIIFERLLEMHAHGVEIDLSTLAEELRTAKQLDEVGSFNYLMQVSKQVPTTAQVEYFLERVKYLWEMRRGITLASLFIEDMYTSTDGREGLMERAGALGQRLITFGRKHETKTLVERVTEVERDTVERIEEREDRSKWLYTGLKKFDEHFRPFGCQREDHLINIMGGSSQGKSAILRQFSNGFLHAGKRGLVFTRETSIEGWIEQAAASWCGIDLMNPGGTPLAEKKKFIDECAWLREKAAGKLLWCVQHEREAPLASVLDIEARYRAHVNRFGPMDYVSVDYLQLFDASKRCSNRQEEISDISIRLQGLCRESDNVWLVASQMVVLQRWGFALRHLRYSKQS